jgi:hypothetical protein
MKTRWLGLVARIGREDRLQHIGGKVKKEETTRKTKKYCVHTFKMDVGKVG